MINRFTEISIKVDEEVFKKSVEFEANNIIEKLLADVFTNIEFKEFNVDDIYEYLNENLGFVLYRNLQEGRYLTMEDFFFLCDYAFKSFWKHMNQNDPDPMIRSSALFSVEEKKEDEDKK